MTIDERIEHLATKHGMGLDRDDPLLLVQTMMDHLWTDSQKAQEALLDRYKEGWQGVVAQWDHESKAKAEHILDATLTATQEALAQTLEDGATALRHEIGQALEHFQAQRQAVQSVSM